MSTTRAHIDQPPTTYEGLVGELMPTAIHDKVAYENAMEMIRRLAVIPHLTGGQLRYVETVSILVEVYEREHYPIRYKATPLEVLKSLMEDHEMTGADLARLLNVGTPLVCRILKGERGITPHARKLADHFKLRADLFIE